MMKIITFLAISFLATITSNQSPKNTITITITIENIKQQQGIIAVAAYDSPLGFLDEGKEIAAVSKAVTESTITITMELPKQGVYGFALYQDRNEDGIFNKNFLGIPKEPYGFSRIEKMIFSKPKFEKCKIDTNTQKSITIKLLNE